MNNKELEAIAIKAFKDKKELYRLAEILIEGILINEKKRLGLNEEDELVITDLDQIAE